MHLKFLPLYKVHVHTVSAVLKGLCYPHCRGLSDQIEYSTIAHMDITVVNIPQQRFEQLFFAFDVNMDGYIDQSELNTLIHKSHSLFDTLTLESFGSLIVALSIVMDTNNDLLISYSEVLKLFGAY